MRGRLQPPTPELIRDCAEYLNLFQAAADIKMQMTQMQVEQQHDNFSGFAAQDFRFASIPNLI